MNQNIKDKLWKGLIDEVGLEQFENYIVSESRKIDFSNRSTWKFKDIYIRAKKFYSNLTTDEKNRLLLIETISWSTSIFLSQSTMFHIFINGVGINYKNNCYHDKRKIGFISLLLLREINLFEHQHAKLKMKEHYNIGGKHKIDNFNMHNNIFIYGNGFTKQLKLDWSNDKKLLKIAKSRFLLQNEYQRSQEEDIESDFLINTINFYIDDSDALGGGFLENINNAHYSKSYEFWLLLWELQNERYKLGIKDNYIIDNIIETLKENYGRFEEKWKKFDWVGLDLEKKLMSSKVVMTTNYDDIFFFEDKKPIHLHGNINNIKTSWYVDKWRETIFEIKETLGCNTTTFFGFSGDHDPHIINFINGLSQVKWVNVIDKFDIKNDYLHFLKWVKWKRMLPSKVVWVFDNTISYD